MNEITNEIYKGLNLLPRDLQGWNGTLPIFEQLIDEVKPNHIIEVGTWKGQSAITMAKAIQKRKMATKITCVDTWLGALEFWSNLKGTPERNLLLKNGYPQIYFQFLSNVVHEGVQDIITPFPNTSFIAAKYFIETKISADLIYIDASHEYEDVLSDCKMYWDVVRSGGLLFGDDWRWNSVSTAVVEFAKIKGITIRHQGDDHWIIKKP
jgi:predicted O-methyltransferase YrrM